LSHSCSCNPRNWCLIHLHLRRKRRIRHLHLRSHMWLKRKHHLRHWIKLLVQRRIRIHLHVLINLGVILKLLNDFLNLLIRHFLSFILTINAIFNLIFVIVFKEFHELTFNMLNFFLQVHIFSWLNGFFAILKRCLVASKTRHAVIELCDFQQISHLRISLKRFGSSLSVLHYQRRLILDIHNQLLTILHQSHQHGKCFIIFFA
jgi:hypothetical protein